jgi:hypothetical protein
MNLFTCNIFDDFLSKLAQSDALAGNLGFFSNQAKDVSGGGVGVHAQKEVWGGQVKEVKGM